VENQPVEKQHAEAHSAKPYVVVWVMLMGLTLLTWITGTMHLQYALPVAVAIALTVALWAVSVIAHGAAVSGSLPAAVAALAPSAACLVCAGFTFARTH